MNEWALWVEGKMSAVRWFRRERERTHSSIVLLHFLFLSTLTPTEKPPPAEAAAAGSSGWRLTTPNVSSPSAVVCSVVCASPFGVWGPPPVAPAPAALARCNSPCPCPCPAARWMGASAAWPLLWAAWVLTAWTSILSAGGAVPPPPTISMAVAVAVQSWRCRGGEAEQLTQGK
jgi:hypothetical protein